jgi:hypothetical protein
MPTRWPLCTAMGDAVEGEQVIASVVKHSCGSSARRRSFQAAIRGRAISRESRPSRHIDACVISRMDVGGDYGCGRCRRLGLSVKTEGRQEALSPERESVKAAFRRVWACVRRQGRIGQISLDGSMSLRIGASEAFAPLPSRWIRVRLRS